MASNYAGALSGAASGAQVGTMVMPGIGTAIGAVIGGAAGLFGGKQKASPVANYKPVDIAEEQKRAIDANAANFDAAATLSAKTNTFEQSEAQRLLEQAIPGFSAIQQRMLAQVNQDLNTQTTLPPEVQDQIARFAAEKGVTRGTAGNFNAFNLVKDFGFNLVDWQQASRARALNTLSTVYGMAPKVNIMSPMAHMVDPNLAIQVAGRTGEMQYNIQQADLNAQTAATNYNRSQLAGALASIGPLAQGIAAGYAAKPELAGMQAKVGAAPQSAGTTWMPSSSPGHTGQFNPAVTTAPAFN